MLKQTHILIDNSDFLYHFASAQIYPKYLIYKTNNSCSQASGRRTFSTSLKKEKKKKFRLNKYSYRSSASLVIREMQIKTTVWDFTDGPGAKMPSSQCRGPGFDPWSYFRSCMQLRSLHATMTILQVETQT